MKKRTLISILLALIVLFCTNKYWLISRPTPIDFEISTIKEGGGCSAEVQLSRKDNDKFKNIDKQDIYINFGQIYQAHFKIRHIKSLKHLKIIFSRLNTPIAINQLQIKEGEIKPDLTRFSSNSKLEIKNDSLIIYPNGEEIVLNYKDKFKVKSKKKFDFKIFIIITILTFLFSYKISNYIADFKSIKNQPAAEIIFLTIFFLFLFVPISYINNDEISKKENRTLATWKPLIQNDEINFNFGKDFNKWFNDRFNLREIFLNIHTQIMLCLTNEAEKGFVDKNGFSYSKGEVYKVVHKNIKQEDFEGLIEFNRICKENNIELYIIIVPDKIDIYPLSKEILLNDNSTNILAEKIKTINQQEGAHIIYPLKELQKASEENYMFFKTEHHWTDDGAFVGYKALMKEILKQHNDIKVLNENDFNFSYNKFVRAEWGREYDYGQNSWRLNLPKNYIEKHHQNHYRYFTHKDFDKVQIDVNGITKTFYYPFGADYKVVQFGTSQGENLAEFIPYTFKNVKRIRNNMGEFMGEKEFKIKKYFIKDILDYKPDMVIFCITYGNLAQMHEYNME